MLCFFQHMIQRLSKVQLSSVFVGVCVALLSLMILSAHFTVIISALLCPLLTFMVVSMIFIVNSKMYQLKNTNIGDNLLGVCIGLIWILTIYIVSF